MLFIRLTRQIKLQYKRHFHSTFIKNEKKTILESSTTSQASNSVPKTETENIIGSPMHNVTKIDKWILVWVKRYPSKEEVPAQVPIECMQRAHSVVRIRISLLMMASVIVAFYMSAMQGKTEYGEKGMTAETQKYYKEVKEKMRKEAAEAKKRTAEA